MQAAFQKGIIIKLSSVYNSIVIARHEVPKPFDYAQDFVLSFCRRTKQSQKPEEPMKKMVLVQISVWLLCGGLTESDQALLFYPEP